MFEGCSIAIRDYEAGVPSAAVSVIRSDWEGLGRMRKCDRGDGDVV